MLPHLTILGADVQGSGSSGEARTTGRHGGCGASRDCCTGRRYRNDGLQCSDGQRNPGQSPGAPIHSPALSCPCRMHLPTTRLDNTRDSAQVRVHRVHFRLEDKTSIEGLTEGASDISCNLLSTIDPCPIPPVVMILGRPFNVGFVLPGLTLCSTDAEGKQTTEAAEQKSEDAPQEKGLMHKRLLLEKFAVYINTDDNTSMPCDSGKVLEHSMKGIFDEPEFSDAGRRMTSSHL